MHRRRFRRLELGLHDIRIACLHPRAADQRILGLRVGDLQFHVVWKRFVGRTRVADRCRATLIRRCNRIQHGELGRQFLVGVVGVPGGIGADFCRLTLAVLVTVVEHADQRKSVNQIAPVLVLHQLAEHFSSGLQLAWGEMLLSTNHKDHVFNDSIVELLPRRAVDRMRKVDSCDNGADVLLDLLDLHGLGGNPRRSSAHDLAPHVLTRRSWRARVAFRKATLANSIGRMFASIKYCPTAMSRLAIADSTAEGRTRAYARGCPCAVARLTCHCEYNPNVLWLAPGPGNRPVETWRGVWVPSAAAVVPRWPQRRYG